MCIFLEQFFLSGLGFLCFDAFTQGQFAYSVASF